MIPKEEKEGWDYVAVKIKEEQNHIIMVIFIA